MKKITEMLHIAILAIYKYYSEQNKLPEINNMVEANEVLQNAKLIFEPILMLVLLVSCLSSFIWS